ncbi:MAG: 6-phosphogluconolactonase [Acidobacteriota bacterium]|jgi:6-phosphogluconolactonase
MIEGMPAPDPAVRILEDPAAVAREAARRFAAAAARAVDGSSGLRVALAGGRTPLETYRLLARDDTFRYSVHWPSVEFFWGDERFVPADHPDSNYRAARETLLDPLGISPAQVHPIPTDTVDAAAAADAYQRLLAALFGSRPAPRLDLVLLGLGTDGHTASLFPGSLPPDEGRWVAATRNPADGSARITLTPETLRAAREVVFLVCGSEKAVALERTLRAKEPDPALPGSLLGRPGAKIRWIVDRAAAARIAEPPGGEEG